MRNGLSSVGIGSPQMSNVVEGYWPREGASAGFCLLGMYLVCITRLQSPDSLWMRRKTLFVGRLPLHPFHHPSTTPWLSPWTLMCSPSFDNTHTWMVSSSKLTASAHWMSLPWAFHPAASLHAHHLGLIVMATPKPELASE